MAGVQQLNALLQSHLASSGQRFFSIETQTAAEEAHSGHSAPAKGLRAMIDEAKNLPVANRVGDLTWSF